MKSKTIPTAIQGKYSGYSPNGPILISEEPIQIKNDQEQVDGKANIYLEFLPSVRVQAHVDFSEELKGQLRGIDFLDDSFKFIVNTRLSSDWAIVRNLPNLVATLFNDETITPSSMSYVVFHILNFDSYVGSPVEHALLGSAGRLELPANGWKITIDDTPTTSSSIKELKAVGGYAITHVGKLERENGQSFTQGEGETILGHLLHFLSFVRGFWTPPILPVGYNANDEEVWEKWKTSFNHRWEDFHSWLPNNVLAASEFLPSLFKRFMQYMADPDWERALTTAIYWYIECNTLKNANGEIILGQAALELLSWMFVVNEKKNLTHETFAKIRDDDKVRLMLSQLGIPLDIPKELSHLNKYAKANNLQDGPHVTTHMRHTFVHPPRKQKNFKYPDGRVVVEASLLQLWYVELTLLYLFGHQGEYSSRVHGRNVLVPWTN
jgi:hypothetical protein